MTKSTILFMTVMLLLLSACGEPGNTRTKTPEVIFKTVDVKMFNSLIGEKGMVLIDVNRPDEFSEGHIKGARNMGFFQPEFDAQVAQLDKSKTYLIYSRRDYRSSKAMDKFRTASIFKLINLSGGLEAWEEANMPLEK